MGPEIERMPGGWHSIASMKGIRATELALLLCTFSSLVVGQEFEVAAIKPSAQDAQAQSTAGLHSDGSMVRYTGLSLKLYLGMAHGLKVRSPHNNTMPQNHVDNDCSRFGVGW